MNIRLYTDNDFAMIDKWYLQHSYMHCPKEYLTKDSTFILENEVGEPWLCWTLFLTNSKIAWIEGLISNPELKQGRKDAIKHLHKYIEVFAKGLGYKKIFGMSANEKIAHLTEYDLGYKKTCTTITSFIKDLGE